MHCCYKILGPTWYMFRWRENPGGHGCFGLERLTRKEAMHYEIWEYC